MATFPEGAACRTLTEAYAALGIAITSPRTPWSAQGAEGAIVLTVWADLFTDNSRDVSDVLDAKPHARGPRGAAPPPSSYHRDSDRRSVGPVLVSQDPLR